MEKRKIIIVTGTVGVIAILSILSYFIFFKTNKTEKILESTSNSAENLNKSATEGVLDVNANPLKNAPNTNPIEKANPYSDVKTNPFE